MKNSYFLIRHIAKCDESINFGKIGKIYARSVVAMGMFKLSCDFFCKM